MFLVPHDIYCIYFDFLRFEIRQQVYWMMNLQSNSKSSDFKAE